MAATRGGVFTCASVTQEDAMLNEGSAAALEGPAAMWDASGAAYDEVSYAISDAIAHAAKRLDATAGERVLDVATGTGWAARNAARGGAMVTGVDIAPSLLEAARGLSAHIAPDIVFRRADAVALPFPDGAFDKVISTFGVMFAGDPARAAAELARVLRPGGRLVLAVWVPEGSVQRFFEVVAAFDDRPPPPANPFDWGDPDKAGALLGATFDLTIEHGTNHAYHPSVDAIWDWYVKGFGPLRFLHERLPGERRTALKAAVDPLPTAAPYRTAAGLHVTRDYRVGDRRAPLRRSPTHNRVTAAGEPLSSSGRAARACSTMAPKAAGSCTARSASILRSTSMPALLSPSIRRA
ncbi:MAG: hypothetical protein AcusKO_40480 [Acuticoccus sp.]